jgi:hypothetical protein
MGVTWVMMVLLAQATPETRSIAPREAEVEEAIREPAALPASVDVRSAMGKRFRLIEARLVVDGQEMSHRTAAQGQELENRFRLYDGSLRPGLHSVNVLLVYEGRNSGLFTYMDEYKFNVQATTEFNVAAAGRPATIEVLAYERPGATVPIEKKPMMEIVAPSGSGATATVRPPGR